MLDVHPAHAPAHSWRDILIHLATITIGLFIALSLEAAIEAAHHRHLVKQARENIRREIELNEQAAKKDEVAVQTNADNMKNNLATARDMRDNPNAHKHREMRFAFSWDTFNDSAWRAARDSGALALMPTAEVQLYADSYGEQDLVSRQAVAIFTSETDGFAPMLMEQEPNNPRPEDLRQLMRDSALSYIRLTTLKQIIQQLDKNYADTLRK